MHASKVLSDVFAAKENNTRDEVLRHSSFRGNVMKCRFHDISVLQRGELP
jgi:hypothetical protein